ncbi:uncharacterized protein DUF664 [Propionibacteriaceae bacterium ES.041]|nr:uncharacterized protein DUF664 [Propionibacteriaceae bacterium ES.041]
MTDSRPADPPTELPVVPAAASERAMLEAFLDHQRTVVRRKAEGLTDEQLRTHLPGHPSPLTVGGIIKHLGWVEIKWAQHVFLGRSYADIAEPWASSRRANPNWEWGIGEDTGDQLLIWYDQAIQTARAAYATAGGPDTVSRGAGSADPGEPADEDASPYQLRWILIHLIEEYARHAGHLDLIREHLDGRTGD